MPDFPPLVEALLHSEIYPEKTEDVEIIQTQISFVFLAGNFVYKIKKAVDFGFLNFFSLENRHFFCQQEIRLNQRLCPDIYLEVVPITKKGNKYALKGNGEIVEYAVKMRRLPLHRTMNRLLDEDKLTPQMVVQVAQKLVRFHGQAQIIEKDFGDIQSARLITKENYSETEKYLGITISSDEFERIKSYSHAFMANNTAVFEKRGRDCHGDLHTDHICFGKEIYIFNCIEFNDWFRFIDVANDIAFLSMDLDFHGRPDLSHYFIEAYIRMSTDQDIQQLLNFYKCYRAFVRGKVESFKLDDPLIPDEEKQTILKPASRYFELADSYALRDV